MESTNKYVPRPDEINLIPTGSCECGCGEPTNLAKRTVRSYRWYLGHPQPFLRGHSKGNRDKGPKSRNWKGGRYLHKTGYWYVYAPDSPMANRDGHVLEHRLVMSQVLGRPLDSKTEHVHHINGDKQDNRHWNLEVLSPSEHAKKHPGERNYDSERMRQVGLKGASARWGKDYT